MRRFLLAFTIVAVVAVPSAVGAAAVDATGVVSGAGTSWSMRLTAGDDPIRCFFFELPPGVEVTAMPSPTGWFVGANAGNRRQVGGVAAPGVTGIAPGASMTFAFTTNAPIPAGSSGALRTSATCAQGSDKVGTWTDSSPCKCLSFEARLVPKSIAFVNPGDTTGMQMQMTFAWAMNCTAGMGNCSGQFDLLPPQPAVKLKTRFQPIGAKINCVGPCGKLTNGTSKMKLFGGPKFAFGSRGKKTKSMQITVRRTCQGQKLAPRKLTIVFNRIGLVDKKKSDWNGDGKPG